MKDTTNQVAAPTQEPAEQNVPFFARYLEGQATTQTEAAGGINQTLKYPSDRDEWWDNSDV